MKTRKPYYRWTKNDLEQVLELWETKSVGEIADNLGTTKMTIYSIAKRFRNAGVKLPKKNRAGYLESLIQEVIKARKS